jgi:hypothetical protein
MQLLEHHPWGYSGDDLDLATLVYQLRGCQFMYVLNHHLGLPSLCTLQAHLIFTSITPTIGSISPDQFDANINTLIITSHTHLVVPLCGHSVMMDKIALEERASHYCPANCIIGLCYSHPILFSHCASLPFRYTSLSPCCLLMLPLSLTHPDSSSHEPSFPGL